MVARRSSFSPSASASRKPDRVRRGNLSTDLTLESKNVSQPLQVTSFHEPDRKPAGAASKKFLHQAQKYYKARGTEAIAIIAVNVFLSAAALIALARLIPYQTAQRDRLEEISNEVRNVGQRVDVLRARLPESLDSGKSKYTFLRQQGWIRPNQLTIKLLEPTVTNSSQGSTSDSTPKR